MKAVAPEDVVIQAFAERWANYYKVWQVLDTTTVNVGVGSTNVYASVGQEDNNVDAIIVFYDDNGNAQNSAIEVWVSNDLGTTWFKVRDENNAHLAINRRLAIVVDNLLGFRVRITAAKAGGAENVDVTVVARRRNLQPRKFVSQMVQSGAIGSKSLGG